MANIRSNVFADLATLMTPFIHTHFILKNNLTGKFSFYVVSDIQKYRLSLLGVFP